MRHKMAVALLLGWLAAAPRIAAQEPTFGWATFDEAPPTTIWPPSDVAIPPPAAASGEIGATEAWSWQTAWGVVSLHAIPAGPRIAPDGELYHPNFTLDLDFNFWVWRSQRVYVFADMSLWGETGEDGVTNGRDGFLGTSKREFDLSGGVAWNYAGSWELRAFGYTDNNLNRGTDLVTPSGFNDGFGIENRYYLSPEYAKLGQTGFDVTKATFVSIGYYPSKSMIGNDGQQFEPGMMLRAYLTYDLWDWPCYVYGDVTYISERSFRPRLLLFDLGVAVRPFSALRQFELRLGAQDTADLRVRDDFNLWYVSLRYIY